VAGGETAGAPANGEAPEPAIVAAPQASVNPETVTEVDGRKRRRRRRRRRGGSGGANAANGVLGAGTLPDRHIISVDGDGGAQPTGQTAPPQPNRQLAPWNRPRKGEIALEPPPPSLSAPVEDVRATAPSRRRAPARPAASTRVEPIEAAEIKALPAPARKKTAARTSTAKKAVAKKTVAKKTAVKATGAKKAPARKATSAKKTVRKKT
jgi:ribonuclease E